MRNNFFVCFLSSTSPRGDLDPRVFGATFSRKKLTLSDRIRLAMQLATSVNSIHVLEFVHKSIRPETILIFEHNDSHN